MQKDTFKDDFITDMLYGHMTTDYFEFFCGKCKNMVEVEFLGTDPSSPNFKAICPECGEIGVFKTRIKNMYNRNH
jgi:hypothetical protein